MSSSSAFEFEGYLVEQPQVSEGGFARVYRATKLNNPNWKVAMKVLKDDFIGNESWRDRFNTEAETVRLINHKNVVRVDDVLIEDCIIIMEWIEGYTLEKWREQHNQPDTKLLIDIALQMCEALEAVHEKEIAHHDIKPDNFIIRTKDLAPILIDFGLSWSVTNKLPTELVGYGGRYFLAPEQLTNPPSKEAEADIYTLGATLYYLFTGEHYILRDAYKKWKTQTFKQNLDEIDRAISEDEPDWEFLYQCIDGVYSNSVHEILKKMMLKTPAQRSSITEVCELFKPLKDEMARPRGPIQTPTKRRETESYNGDLYVLTAKQRGQAIELKHKCKLEMNQNGMLVSPDLYMMPNQEFLDFILVDQSGNQVTNEIVKANSNPFRISISKSGEEIIIEETNSIRLIHEVADAIPGVMSLIREVIYSDILFIIDGSMLKAEMNDVIGYLQKLHDRLNIYGHPHKFSALLFGEYNDIPWMKVPWLHENLLHNNDPSELIDKIKHIIEQAQPFRKAHCGALEYALSIADLNNTSDRKSIRHIVIISKSPPHPTPEQRERFNLIEHTTDEFNHSINWQIPLNSLRSKGIEMHVMVPDHKFSSDISDYAHFVWSTMDPHYGFITNNENLFKKIIESNPMPYDTTHQIRYPLVKPLVPPVFRNKGGI